MLLSSHDTACPCKTGLHALLPGLVVSDMENISQGDSGSGPNPTLGSIFKIPRHTVSDGVYMDSYPGK